MGNMQEPVLMVYVWCARTSANGVPSYLYAACYELIVRYNPITSHSLSPTRQGTRQLLGYSPMLQATSWYYCCSGPRCTLQLACIPRVAMQAVSQYAALIHRIANTSDRRKRQVKERTLEMMIRIPPHWFVILAVLLGLLSIRRRLYPKQYCT